MAILAERGQLRRCGLAPVGEDLLRLLLEGSKFGVAEDRVFHFGELQLKPRVAGTVCGLEQNAPHAGEHFPIRAERVQITLRNTTAQATVDVLKVFRLGAVDIAGRLRLKSFLGSAISESGTIRA